MTAMMGADQKVDRLQEVQRDVAQTQDQVRELKQALDQRTDALTKLIQQQSDSIRTELSKLQQSIGERVDKAIAQPLADLGTKLDSSSTSSQSVTQSLVDLNDKIAKLEQRMKDLDQAVRILQTPPTAPTPAVPPAEQLFNSAETDKTAGKYDVALDEYALYVKAYGDTAAAADAQYAIGEIHYNRRDYGRAMDAFDAVIQKYPARGLNAMFMQGQTLAAMGERAKALETFRAILKRSPGAELAAKVRGRITQLSPPARKSARKKQEG